METPHPLSPPHKTSLQLAVQFNGLSLQRYLTFNKINALTQGNDSLGPAVINDKLVGKVFVVQGPPLGGPTISPTLPTCKAVLALEVFISVCDKERVSGTEC